MCAWLGFRRHLAVVAIVGLGVLGSVGAAWGGPAEDQPLDDPGLATFFHPSSQYTPGTPVTVGLKATQFAWGNHLSVEDQFPTGWSVSGISHSGTLQSGKIVWQMPLGGGESVTLTYVATPPSGTTGLQWFRAVATFSSDSTSQQTPADRPILPLGSTCTLGCGASASPSSGTAPLAVQFTGSASPQNCSGSLSYDWDFGDGTAHATEASPSHVYQKVGTYTWTMTATIEGVTCTKSGTVTVMPCSLTCGASASPTSGGAPLSVQFSGSATTNCSGGASYDWDFGDGSPHANLQNVSHTYPTAGTYTWKLTVTAGDQSCTKTGSITVLTCSLTCSASASAVAGRPPLAVTFKVGGNAGNCADPLVLDLDFGDGSPHSSATTVTHTYSSVGLYTWKLTARSGSVTCEKSGRLMVSNAPPLSSPWARTYMISNAAHTSGALGTSWLSDAVLHNPGSSATTATIFYLEKDLDNTGSLGWSVPVAAGQSVKLADIVASTFGRSASSGALLIGASGELIITSRTFNDATSGTYGQYIEGYPSAKAIQGNEKVRLIQLTRNASYRTNIGFASGRGNDLSIKLDLYRANGTLLRTSNVALKPFSYTQINDVFAPWGTGIDDAYAVISSTTPEASYFAYASVIDNRTGDPVSVVPVGRGLQAVARQDAAVATGAVADAGAPEAQSIGPTDVPAAPETVTLQVVGSNAYCQLGSTNQPFARTVPVEIPGLLGVIQVSTGSRHTIARLANRTIYLLGANDAGQLGDKTFTHRSAPAILDTLSDLSDAHAGAYHTMAVRAVDGSVWEWGDGSNEPRQVSGLNGVVQAVGQGHRIVLRSNGSLWGWGANSFGQLGNGNNSSQSAPVQVVGLGNIKQIAVGENHTLALATDGKVWAWGYNRHGELGDGSNQDRNLPVPVSGLSGIVRIAAGRYSSYAVGGDGRVWAWGVNDFGELGDGTTSARNTPVAVVGLSGVVEVAGGWAFALARRTDGSVWAWGYNGDGELGDGTRERRLTPVRVLNVSGATGIAAGDWQSYAIGAGGKVWAWGEDLFGQLGMRRTVYSSTPLTQTAVGDSIQVAAGAYHSLAVRSDGKVVSWGSNSEGQLGYVTSWQVSEQPKAIPNLDGIVAVAAGYWHSLALSSTGEVWSWGSNMRGQLGSGSTASRTAPAKVQGLPQIAAVVAGEQHTLALSTTGKIWAWGYNNSGQVGNGTRATQLTPVELAGLSGVKAIGAGANHSLAVTEDGSLYVWGSNANRQLGDGGTNDRFAPFKLTTLSGVTRADGGWGHTLALKNDGSVWSWGSNGYGQLGVGAAVSVSSLPVKVTGVSNVEGIVAGSWYSIALQGAAGISVWGRNWLGELGDRTTVPKYVPNFLPSLNQVFAAAAGVEHTLLLSGSAPCWLSCAAEASPTSGAPGLTVSFTGSAQAAGCASAPAFDWDFGDGTAHSSAANPSHTYGTEGVFTWRLAVTAGSTTCSRTGEIAVGSACVTPARPVISRVGTVASGADYTVGWTSTSPDNTYELQEATDPGFADAQTFMVGASSRSFKHEVPSETTYHYRVRAVDVCGSGTLLSEWSETAAVTIEAPVGQRLYVLAAAHLSGLAGTNWRTDLEVHNPTSAAATFTIELLKRDQQNTAPQNVIRTLAAGQSERFADVLDTLFGFSGAATLRLTPTTGQLMVTSRTYNNQPAGTYGQFIPAAAASEAVPFGQPARLVQLSQATSQSEGFRTNLGFVNTTGMTITIDCRLFRADSVLLGSQSFQLRPHEFKQIDKVFTRVTAAEVADGYAVLSTGTVDGAFLAYASVIDNRSGDPVYVPARVVAQGSSGREELVLTLPGGVPMTLVRVPQGSFVMGSPSGERSRLANEGPQHSVTLTRDVFIGKTEVTQAQWRAVMGTLPQQDCGVGSDRPVCGVSWLAITGPGGFLERANAHLVASGQVSASGLRLPSEAEWERAARAGSTTRFSFGDVLTCDDACQACELASKYVWWCGNDSPSGAKPVGEKRPNGFGLFDIHGNLWEWVNDWAGPYGSASQVDPAGPASGTTRIARGGSFPGSLGNSRSARRLELVPSSGYLYVGFRVALTP
ncbi:MAG: SUMF1/EgtB/PvdO family nonheme iron enzyme [Thermoanaerobaculaceae bacterium]|nr:SUMF1/EgtB/PvdO family nonheme iron enzyme [Thermoanaerobaculaceae bacterium]MDI9620980.1 PKD domain-containing protein [Acidobacteriota bacterium]NLH09706.1 SUMF1/EgtB/PvdO family nonheme iron enzyme [Holophagae bacterium]HPW56369.1 PKD domain-containing protein [Thermoanaerobaculaceae bacterium]